MSESLKTVCQALKAVFLLLKPKQHPVSFVLLIGRVHQGKSTVLKQSGLKLYPLKEPSMLLYYNQDGVVLELCESWLKQSDVLLRNVLRQLNRIHPLVKISGLALCVDLQGLVDIGHEEIKRAMMMHVQWLKRFMLALDHSVDVSIFFTKSDVMAGFIPFFQSEYASEFLKSLGFSLESRLPHESVLMQYRQQYERLVENLTRQILPKLHAVRSSALRTLIREFPLQLASLSNVIQGLVDILLKEGIRLQGLYWMSADSRAHHVDRLHSKIEAEYGLVVQPQATSFRPQPAYFVQGAFEHVLSHMKPTRLAWSPPIKRMLLGMLSLFCCVFALMAYKHLQTTRFLDEASEELLAYDLLLRTGQKPTAAAFHLTQALHALHAIPYPMQDIRTVHQLKTLISHHTDETLLRGFLPQLLQTLEVQIRGAQTVPVARYDALKTYLRLTTPQYFSAPLIREWFYHEWEQRPPQSLEKSKALLEEVLSHPVRGIATDPGLITSARNYLTALPSGYFYYSIAKKSLNHSTTSMQLPGFVMGTAEIPTIYTKAAFHDTVSQLLQVAAHLGREEWVLGRQEVQDLSALVTAAYCFEYTTFWKQWMQQTHVRTIHSFEEGLQLSKQLVEAQSFSKLIGFIREQTSPLQTEDRQLFNEKIAAQFTSFHFLSARSIREIDQAVRELENFLAPLVLVHDDGQTVFSFTKGRFQGEVFSDALSLLSQRANGLPPVMAAWVKQLSDSIWSIFIQQSRQYLNQKWLSVVYQPYEKTIAHRFPFEVNAVEEVSLKDFEAFFAHQGVLAQFVTAYVYPFLDRSEAQWKVKTRDGLMMPIAEEMMGELIRANVISSMFFAPTNPHGHIDFRLEKVSLDPVVSQLSLTVGQSVMTDTQTTPTAAEFQWPSEHALLHIEAVDGKQFNLEESGVWAFFKMLQKINVLVDAEDTSTLQLLFEVNGNAGRYVLKTQNQINPFSPGILDGFILKQAIV